MPVVIGVWAVLGGPHQHRFAVQLTELVAGDFPAAPFGSGKRGVCLCLILE